LATDVDTGDQSVVAAMRVGAVDGHGLFGVLDETAEVCSAMTADGAASIWVACVPRPWPDRIVLSVGARTEGDAVTGRLRPAR
jgi:hypothetical protein